MQTPLRALPVQLPLATIRVHSQADVAPHGFQPMWTAGPRLESADTQRGNWGLWEGDRGTSSDSGRGSHHHVEPEKRPDQSREGCLQASRTMSTVLSSAWPQAAPSHSSPPSLSCHSVCDSSSNSTVSLPSSIIQQTLSHHGRPHSELRLCRDLQMPHFKLSATKGRIGQQEAG